MQKMYKPARIAIIFLITAVMFSIYIVDLYRIQIYEARALDPYTTPPRATTRTINLPAARGNIYDRNGILLASGRASFDVMLDFNTMRPRGSRVMNRSILDLIYTTIERGYEYTDTLPITTGAPFAFFADMRREERRWLDAFFAEHRIDPDISASDLLAWMRNHYNIDYTIGILDARLIMGIRYELEMRFIISNLNPYVFARDVSTDFVSLLAERDYAGVFVERSSIREYHTSYAAHVLGYIRRMSPEQFEVLREYGYPMDALVGQIGAEYAFERVLRGIDGRQRIRMAADGTVVDVITVREPQPGNHVYLTLDIDLQTVVEHSLRTQINLINSEREIDASLSNEVIDIEEILIPGGAVVVTNVRTGELLAAASYPTFNPRTLGQDFGMLNLDSRNPMFNRATHGRFIPGSTFKMITGFAGLRHGLVDRHTTIGCAGRYMRYAAHNFTPSCWIFSLVGVGHGGVDMVRAMEASCNYYFMWVADRLPAEQGSSYQQGNILAGISREFGLGVNTGIELPESTGRLTTPEWLREAYAHGLVDHPSWSSALSVTTGFGQGHNRFTPLQLASYTATIANGGTLFEMSILQRVMSNDFSEALHTFEPTVRSQIEETYHLELIREGMLAASRGNEGTARSVFRNYPILVGSKTGTAQVAGRDVNDGIFVAYAPHNNPEIAVAIVIEKGGSGSAVMDIARMIFDYYFSTESAIMVVPYGQLVP